MIGPTNTIPPLKEEVHRFLSSFLGQYHFYQIEAKLMIKRTTFVTKHAEAKV